MQREELVDLNAFVMVAEEQSFTRAAAKLGTSQSSLSHTIRRLEARLGVRLLTRTTRNVAPTEAGERLLRTLRPALESIGAEFASLSELRVRPAGTIRITISEHATITVLWPVLERLLSDYPDIHAELSIDSGLTDIVAERFDAGVRLGEALAKDMIAVRIGPDLRMAVVGSPAYFQERPAPRTPHDLAEHRCINARMLSAGCLGVGEGRPRCACSRRGAARLRQRADDRPCGRGGIWARFRYGRPGRGASRGRSLGPGDGGLVSDLSRLPPLLSKPAGALGGLRAPGRGPPP
jgi:DNA-binding transcriptional LysR family regulator